MQLGSALPLPCPRTRSRQPHTPWPRPPACARPRRRRVLALEADGCEERGIKKLLWPHGWKSCIGLQFLCPDFQKKLSMPRFLLTWQCRFLLTGVATRHDGSAPSSVPLFDAPHRHGDSSPFSVLLLVVPLPRRGRRGSDADAPVPVASPSSVHVHRTVVREQWCSGGFVGGVQTFLF